LTQKVVGRQCSGCGRFDTDANRRMTTAGHFRSSDRPGIGYADDRSRSTPVIGRSTLGGGHSPNRSFATL
jgi:hypothetical protein